MDGADQLGEHRRVWERKAVLRLVYEDFYDRIAAACRPGLTLEIGGGIGNLKRRLADVILTDIQRAPWLDCVADAQRLPFAAGSASKSRCETRSTRCQPYHAGAVSQVRPSPRSARFAAFAGCSWWKRP